MAGGSEPHPRMRWHEWMGIDKWHLIHRSRKPTKKKVRTEWGYDVHGIPRQEHSEFRPRYQWDSLLPPLAEALETPFKPQPNLAANWKPV